MNRITRSVCTGLTVGLTAGALAVAAWAQPVQGMASPMPLIQAPQEPQQPQQPQTEPQQQMPSSEAARTATFSGTIVKVGDTFALRDSSGSVYRLDDSSQASKFEGKPVKVVGALDSQTRTIHVSSIEGGS